MMRKQGLFFWLIVLCIQTMPHIVSSQVYFTNGLKIQEVTDTSAVIWTRLCKDSNKKQSVIKGFNSIRNKPQQLLIST